MIPSAKILRHAFIFVLLLILASWIWLFLNVTPSEAQTGVTPPVRKKTALKRKLSLEEREELNLNKAIEHCRRAIARYPTGEFIPETMFQLSELLVKKAKLELNRKMEKYEADLERFDKGFLKEEPLEPRLSYKESIDLCSEILERFPDVKFKDKVLYLLGICQYEEGEKENAKRTFLELIEQFPQGPFTSEATFRIGECYFDNQEYSKAIETYQKILNTWYSPFFATALYKKAWCYYKLGDYSQAISTFYYLLTDITLMDSVKSEILGKSQVELKQETIEYIAISFSEYGGLKTALEFLEEKDSGEFAPRILHKLGEVYQKRNFYEEALETYSVVLKKFPYYPDAPQVQYNIFECYDKQHDLQNATLARTNFLRKFGPESPWAQINTDEKIKQKVTELKNKIDFRIATVLLGSADSLFTIKKFDSAIEKYQYFVNGFSEDDRAPEAAFKIAECYYQISQFEMAAKKYQEVVKRYSESKFVEDAAYNRIICYVQILETEKEPVADTLVIVQKGRKLPIPLKSTTQKKLIIACKDFLKRLPRSNKSPEILLKLGEIFMKLERYDFAKKFLSKVLYGAIKHKKGTEYYTKAASLMAQANFKNGNYKQAEIWYSMLIKENPDSLELMEKSQKMLASSRYKMAESLAEKGYIQKAAYFFELSAINSSDPKIAEVATFEAASNYEKANDIQRAAATYEKFYKLYPNSENADHAIYRAATLREKLSQWYLAAQNYLKLVKRNPHSETAPAALFSAGLCYENAKDWFSAAKIFEKYSLQYPADKDKLLEARFRVGYAYFERKQYFRAASAFQKLINTHRTFKKKDASIDDYYVAQAQFMIGEIKHYEFSRIKLVAPLEINLKRKQTVFNKMLQNYVEATKYQVAEWTTASFHRIGEGFEEFGQAFLNSPPPSGLSEAELKTYWSKIEEKWVLPFQTKALEYYTANEKLAVENNVQNPWIEKSKKRILLLSQKLAVSDNPPPDTVDSGNGTSKN